MYYIQSIYLIFFINSLEMELVIFTMPVTPGVIELTEV